MDFSNDLDAAISENEATILLGLSVRTLQAWRVYGGGPVYMKIGRSVRYQRRELLAFMETRKVMASIPKPKPYRRKLRRPRLVSNLTEPNSH